jgi:hypothetical protein
MDREFLKWVREHEELSSRHGECRIGVQDCDTVFHQFMTPIDRQGKRDVQAIMLVETKTRNGRPDASQHDTWYKLHQFSGQKEIDGQLVRFLGVYCLLLSGTTPENSTLMQWGWFKNRRELHLTTLDDVQALVDLLSFKLHPKTLRRNWLRRHHKTRELAIQQQAPLGFTEFKKVVVRS